MLQFCSEEGLTGYCDYSIVPDICRQDDGKT